jgi:sugar phosphate isomerase/epimerase
MCWPPGIAERRYAGVTHLDVTDWGPEVVRHVHDLTGRFGVRISGLGYYPNPLAADAAEAAAAVAHLRRVIDAAADLGVGVVNSFAGRDPGRTVEENWPRFLETWRPLVQHAEDRGVRIGIENCPMLFTADEWPGGKNLATSPAIWRRMFEAIPSRSFGLNYDPSHLVWQGMDYLAPLAEFGDRLVHVHAKDARIDRAALDAHGVWPTRSCGTPRSSRAWATCVGAPSSRPSATSVMTARSPSRSRTAPSRARSGAARTR